MMTRLKALFMRLTTFASNHRQLTMGFAALCFLALVLSNWTLLRVNVSGSSDEVVVTMRPSSEPVTSANARVIGTSWRIVRTDEVAINVRSDVAETDTQVHIKPFRFMNIDTSLKPQKEVDTLVHDSGGSICSFRSTSAYVCRSGRLYRVGESILDGESLVQPRLSIVGTPVNYKTGILAFAYIGKTNNASLIYTNGVSTKVVVRDASAYPDLFKEDSVIVSEVDNGDRFVVTSPESKRFWLFDGSGDTKPLNYSYGGDTPKKASGGVVSLSKTQLAVNYREEPEGEKEEREAHSPYTSSVILYGLGGGSIEKVGNYSITEAIDSTDTDGETRLIGDNELAMIDLNENLLFLSVDEGQRLKHTNTIYNVGSYTKTNSQFYYQQGERVYVYTSGNKSSVLIAKAVNASLRNLTHSGSQLMFTGTPNNSRSTESIFVITQDEKTGASAFDVIPYNLNELPLLSSRFKGGALFFSVQLNSQNFDPDSNRSTYDKSEYELKKQVILRRLARDGIDSSDYKIYFKAGP